MVLKSSFDESDDSWFEDMAWARAGPGCAVSEAAEDPVSVEDSEYSEVVGQPLPVSAIDIQCPLSLPLGYDSVLVPQDQAYSWHACLMMMQHMLRITHMDLAMRATMQTVYGMSCMEIYVGDIVPQGGLDLEDCGHLGVPTAAEYRFHGTSKLGGILANGGIQSIFERPLKHYHGWSHTSWQNFPTALQYAWPFCVRVLGRSFWYRPVLVYLVKCYNRCNRKRWDYTRSDCRRYALSYVLVIPCSEASWQKPIQPKK